MSWYCNQSARYSSGTLSWSLSLSFKAQYLTGTLLHTFLSTFSKKYIATGPLKAEATKSCVSGFTPTGSRLWAASPMGRIDTPNLREPMIAVNCCVSSVARLVLFRLSGGGSGRPAVLGGTSDDAGGADAAPSGAGSSMLTVGLSALSPGSAGCGVGWALPTVRSGSSA